MIYRRFQQVALTIFLAILVSACGVQTASPKPTETLPAPTETLPPPTRLTVCLGQEPDSLFPLNNPSSAAQSVLSALYDGPIDTNSYGYQPVILERLPSIDNGDAQLFPQEVSIGDEVVDAGGIPVTLGVGTRIRPAGCRTDACAIEYDGKTSLEMDQLQATFRLLPGLAWSDGEPLTSADALFGYRAAAQGSTGAARYVIDRTQSYEAADETTLQWWGKPGFIDPTYFTNFWLPLPEHLWGEFPIDQLGENPETSRTPVGWGAFILQEWVSGDHITLKANQRYFRRAEGLPAVDSLIFRFTPDAETAISALLAGSCDLLDPSVRLDGQAELLLSMADQDQLQALFTPIPVMEQLAFGIQAAAYDDGKNPTYDRPDFFGDKRVRQALAMCLDRQQVVTTVLSGLSTVPQSYIPVDHPLFNRELSPLSFKVSSAEQLLVEAGWKDTDSDPSTPRRADGVKGVPSGTEFKLTYLTTDAVQRQQVSSLLAESLGRCGIQVEVQLLEAESLYAPGPEGVLFGRSFELVEFAMGSRGFQPPCDWFTSSAMPGKDNNWVGTNVSGYANPAFDAACQESLASLPDESLHSESAARAQALFMDDLPVVPLYWRVKAAAASPAVCNYALDPTASSDLWNIETIASGDACQP